MPSPGTYAATTAFLTQCRAVTADPNGSGSVTWYTTTLWARVSESDAWAFGTASGITMAASVLAELQGAVGANADGSYTIRDANGAEVPRVLTLTSAGACEPSGPPPP